MSKTLKDMAPPGAYIYVNKAKDTFPPLAYGTIEQLKDYWNCEGHLSRLKKYEYQFTITHERKRSR